MNKVHFLLKDKKTKSETLIFLYHTFRGEKYKISTGLKVLPQNWNPNRQRFKELSGVIHKEPNRLLDELEKNWLEACWKVETCEIDENKLKLKFESLRDKTDFKIETDFITYFEQLNKRTEEKKGYSSLRPFVNSLNRLIDFRDSGAIVEFNHFNDKFFAHYIDFLEQKNYSKNNVGQLISKLKWVLNQAVIDGFQKDVSFRNWKVFSEDVYNVYLTVDEIRAIYELSLSPAYDRARDLFVVGCYTGLRAGNYLYLNDINFKGDYLVVNTIKNGPKVTIPTHPYIKAILKKYNNDLPVLSEQKLRKYVKEICEAAKINEPVEWVRTEGGVRVKHVSKKWEMVSTHTARRSFATNAYLAGIPVISIMKITGHKSMKTFLKYVGITDKENAEILAKHDFFN